MSKQKQTTDEERRINIRSFVVGIFIALAVIILYTVLYLNGVIR